MTIEKTLNSSKVKKEKEREKEGFIIMTKYNTGIGSVCMT
jgi:hypothetical protein